MVGQSVMMIVEWQDVISPRCALVFFSLKFMCGQPCEIQLLQQTIIKKKKKKKHAVLGRIHLPDRRLRSIILRVRHVLLISVHIDCFFKGVVCEDVGMFDCKRHMLNTYVGGSFAQNVCGDIWLMTATCNWKAFAKSTLQCLSSKDIMKFNNLKMGKYIRGKKSALQSA